jgi:hypothetical protein
MKHPTEIEFEFERGGVVRAAVLWDSAPETCGAVLRALPLEATVSHSRWSGREVNFPIAFGPGAPARENDTSTVNTGDVIYWREWEKGAKACEALALYYGAEVTRDHRGYLPVNVFARIPQDQWPLATEIGLRIWRQGFERVRMRAAGQAGDVR